MIKFVASEVDNSLTTDNVPQNKFKWHLVMIRVLEQAPDKRLPVKRLRKKVSQPLELCHRDFFFCNLCKRNLKANFRYCVSFVCLVLVCILCKH